MDNVLDFLWSQPSEIKTAIWKVANREYNYLLELRRNESLSEKEMAIQFEKFVTEFGTEEFIRRTYPGRYSDEQISQLSHAAFIDTIK